jgi:hypothetical protein
LSSTSGGGEKSQYQTFPPNKTKPATHRQDNSQTRTTTHLLFNQLINLIIVANESFSPRFGSILIETVED